MKKLNVYLLWMTLLLIVMTACSKGEETKQPSSNESKGESVVLNTYPFTGLETEGEVNQRAYAIMVNNQKAARPQSGLSKADIVFELLTESNITRFLAIYQSTPPEVVGPVRSAREYFFTLADGYDAIYVYHGAADFVENMIQSRGIENLPGSRYDNDGHLFVRESFRKAPHNSYFQFGAANEVSEERGYEITANYEPMLFLTEGEEVTGEEASHVKINYLMSSPVVEYIYDDTSGKYNRYDDGEQTVELDSNIPIEIDNVLIVEADHQVIDAQKRRAIDVHSGGRAYLLQKGKIQYIEWENRDGRIVPVKDGEVVPFVPGRTWINFIPSNAESGGSEQVQVVQDEV